MEESVFSQSPFGTDSSSSSSSNGSSSKRGKKLIFLVILLVILGLIAFGAVKFLGGEGTPATPTPTPTEAVTPTDTPTPTPEVSGSPTPSPKVSPTTAKTTVTPTKAAAGSSVDAASGLDRADLSIIVQNGSGVAGAAKTMGDKLTGLGYKVSSVGNADNSDYAQTEIHVSAAKSKFIALLKKDLGSDYTIGTSASDYTGSGDALVIVGKQ